MSLLYIIIAIIVVSYIIEEYVDYLNLSHELKPIAKKLRGKFSYTTRKKMHLYHLANYKLELYYGMISTLVILSMLVFKGFGAIDSLIQGYFDNPLVVTLVFFGIIGFGSAIISLPWNTYSVFYIENRFGFNRQTVLSFITDKLKGIGLSVILGGGLLLVITWLFYQYPESFWWVAWLVITGFSLFMAMFYSQLIVPLFNKQTPLEQGKLREAIEDTARKAGFNLNEIYVIDGSKRSTKANAYFTGLGTKKRIVLYDTLIQDLSVNEVVAVLAHEIGHYKKHHILWNLGNGIIHTGLMLFVFHSVVSYDALYEAVGASGASFHIGLLVFGFLYAPVTMVLGLFTQYYSRKAEYQADNFAANLGYATHLQSALLILTDKNLSNINPHPVYVFMHYSHPPLNERLLNLEKMQGQDID
ncbi:MAG: M48 family metallopeptidase [Salinivirgaceae bacterium]|jgi:STE24 endopeptidase|nr:M48 family metallopeptidase [Salinivirgaceae bacterium]